MENPVEIAISAAGGVTKLAEALSISSQAVSQWKRIPAERVIDVERVTGVVRQTLRPDLYPAEATATTPKPSKSRAA